jgi:hypothetical protein
MRDFHDLRVWQQAHEITKSIYTVTQDFPRAEQFGLTSQLRRPSASIAAALADGCGRGGNDFGRFCQIGWGALARPSITLSWPETWDSCQSSNGSV